MPDRRPHLERLDDYAARVANAEAAMAAQETKQQEDAAKITALEVTVAELQVQVDALQAVVDALPGL